MVPLMRMIFGCFKDAKISWIFVDTFLDKSYEKVVHTYISDKGYTYVDKNSDKKMNFYMQNGTVKRQYFAQKETIKTF